MITVMKMIRKRKMTVCRRTYTHTRARTRTKLHPRMYAYSRIRSSGEKRQTDKDEERVINH